MPTIKGRHLHYDPSDEGLVRRLGGALVVLWDHLPEIHREMILRQATLMGDRDETVQLRQQLEMFVEKHRADE